MLVNDALEAALVQVLQALVARLVCDIHGTAFKGDARPGRERHGVHLGMDLMDVGPVVMLLHRERPVTEGVLAVRLTGNGTVVAGRDGTLIQGNHRADV